MGAILDKIRELKARKIPQVQEESKKSEPMLLGECYSQGTSGNFPAGKLYAFYISDVKKYENDRNFITTLPKGTEGIIAFAKNKDCTVDEYFSLLMFGKKNAKTINDFAFSDDPIKKECLRDAAQDAVNKWNEKKYEVTTSFRKLEEKYNLKKMKYALMSAKRKVLGK